MHKHFIACKMPGEGGEETDTTLSEEKKENSVRTFTWRELSRLNSRYNAHVAYRGKVSVQVLIILCVPCTYYIHQVYDVSGFVARHPGGVDQIMLGAGHDITKVFESYHKEEIVELVVL